MLTLNKAKNIEMVDYRTRGLYPSTIIELSDTLIGTFAPYPNAYILYDAKPQYSKIRVFLHLITDRNISSFFLSEIIVK